MEWTEIEKDGLPKESDTYVIYAPSCAKIVPLVVTAWYDTDYGWGNLPPAWAKAITHWMKPEPPTNGNNDSVEEDKNKIAICEQCFPNWAFHEICTMAPLLPCANCGRLDSRSEPGGLKVHLFSEDPRKNYKAEELNIKDGEKSARIQIFSESEICRIFGVPTGLLGKDK